MVPGEIKTLCSPRVVGGIPLANYERVSVRQLRSNSSDQAVNGTARPRWFPVHGLRRYRHALCTAVSAENSFNADWPGVWCPTTR